MPTAYTPGLAVAADVLVRKTRRLPLKGEVVARRGEPVEPETVVARTELPGILRTVRAADVLGVDPEEVPAALLLKTGERATAGQLLARTSSFFGLLKTECRSPVDGVVELVSAVNGHVSIREPARPIEVRAYLRGRVAEVLEGEGVVIETRGAFVQGIFGVGGERQGALATVVADPHESLTEAQIQPTHRGRVLVGGSSATAGALRQAAACGVAGIVVGAVLDRDLTDYLGYEIGVAITGHEALPFSLIVTEGFGVIGMAGRTFRLLKSLEGRLASINGATQIRAGVLRPEVVVPHDAAPPGSEPPDDRHDLVVGTAIRVIREPFFGRLGTVAGLPPEPVRIPSGAAVRVLQADLDGEQVIVPRANVEILGG